jgi:cell division protein FtsW (lipid II flippase)
MQQSNKISQFLKTVCEQIRWKKAHDIIEEEIENHIIDQKNAFMANGLNEEVAIDKALKEMGDPVLIGSELDRTHKPEVEWSIILLTGLILILGFALRLLVTYDSNMPLTVSNNLISVVLGIGFMIIVYFLDFTIIGKYPKIIFLALIVVTIGAMGVSPIINGKYFYVQFIVMLFPIAFSGIIYNMRAYGYLGIILSGLFFGFSGFVVLIIPSVSSMFLYSVTCLILLTFAITKGYFNVNKKRAMLLVYIPIIFILFLVTIGILNSPYCLERLLNAFNPYLDPLGTGYIGIVIRDMLVHAKFYKHLELGSSDIILPNINTDYMLTYVIHRLGWISFIFIIAVILAFIIRSSIICVKQKSVLGKLVSIAVLLTFIMQVVIYVASNLGFQLFSPLTLPLISYGGTGTIINMILIGVMLSVFKSGNLACDNLKTSMWRGSKLIKIANGKIIIDLNNIVSKNTKR